MRIVPVAFVLVGLLFISVGQLPSARGEITDVQKDQVINGLKGAASLMKFLEEKNFFSLLTKVSAVAGPLFSVASVIMSIAFMFIDVESPEMALMKKEFGKLNNRLDEWSTEFNDIKRKIDWSAVQMSYSNYERSIRAIHSDLSTIVNSPKEIKDTQRIIFINKYESTFINVAEKLYMGMINTDMIFSENLFKASQKFTQFHRRQVQEFMTGITQLLMQAMQVQASYVSLKYNSTESNKFVESIWTKKMAVLKEKMEQIDRDTSFQWPHQSEKDIDDLLKKNHGVDNKQFTTVAVNFLYDKYDWRHWFVVTYKELSGFAKHTVSECSGFHRFRTNGRNLLVSSKARTDWTMPNQMKEAERVMDAYKQHVVANTQDWASFLVTDLRTRTGKDCSSFRHISAVEWGANVWYWSKTGFLAYRKVCLFNRRLRQNCFNTFLFG